jgi:hypothetical protein
MLPVKGTNGYIRKRKMFQTILLLIIVAVSVGLFLCGYFATGTTKNLLTVIAVLGVLPGAKSVVNLVLFLPYQSLDAEAYGKLSEAAGDKGILYSDLVFTSPSHVMHLDALYASGTEVAGLLLKPKEKAEKEIADYITETMKKRGVSVHVHIFKSIDELKERVAALSEREEPVPDDLAEFLRVILV